MVEAFLCVGIRAGISFFDAVCYSLVVVLFVVAFRASGWGPAGSFFMAKRALSDAADGFAGGFVVASGNRSPL